MIDIHDTIGLLGISLSIYCYAKAQWKPDFTRSVIYYGLNLSGIAAWSVISSRLESGVLRVKHNLGSHKLIWAGAIAETAQPVASAFAAQCDETLFVEQNGLTPSHSEQPSERPRVLCMHFSISRRSREVKGRGPAHKPVDREDPSHHDLVLCLLAGRRGVV